MISAQEALQRLRDGNRRFIDGQTGEGDASIARRDEVSAGQAPFAVVLGCADSRVPAELVFDQGLGDLFVIRVAGNIVEPSLIGSVEFAVASFGTPLVIVLGHSQCGAVGATYDQLMAAGGDLSPNLQAIVDRVRPAVEPLLQSEVRDDRAAFVERAVRSNVRATVEQLQEESEILRSAVTEGRLRILGAEYALETGAVDFFEGVSAN